MPKTMTTPEKDTLRTVVEFVETLPEHRRRIVVRTAEALRNVVRGAGPEGHMALALVGAEFAAQELT